MASAPNRPCPLCSSAEVKWRKRRLIDVPVSWSRFIVDFFVITVLTVEQAHRQGGTAPYAGYHGPASMDVGNRQDLSRDMRESNSAHRALATPRWYWRCRICRQKGEVYDDYVLREPGT